MILKQTHIYGYFKLTDLKDHYEHKHQPDGPKIHDNLVTEFKWSILQNCQI